MKPRELQKLKETAVTIREDILRMTHAAKSGHPGGSLSAVEYLVYLYDKEMNINPNAPQWQERDRFVLSKGHVAPALYAVLAHKSYFPYQDLLTLRKFNSHLQGHPNMNDTAGIDMSTGSLGQGVSAACGMAKAAKYKGQDINVYSLLGDGETNEGQVWEAIAFAVHYKLNNLCVAIDENGLQLDGTTEEVMGAGDLLTRFAAVGAKTLRINGHDFDEIERGFEFFHNNKTSDAPTILLLQTVKGKGISYMENVVGWHGKAPSDDELSLGLAELAKARQEIWEEQA